MAPLQMAAPRVPLPRLDCYRRPRTTERLAFTLKEVATTTTTTMSSHDSVCHHGHNHNNNDNNNSSRRKRSHKRSLQPATTDPSEARQHSHAHCPASPIPSNNMWFASRCWDWPALRSTAANAVTHRLGPRPPTPLRHLQPRCAPWWPLAETRLCVEPPVCPSRWPGLPMTMRSCRKKVAGRARRTGRNHNVMWRSGRRKVVVSGRSFNSKPTCTSGSHRDSLVHPLLPSPLK